jgi:hypothetical protein
VIRRLGDTKNSKNNKIINKEEEVEVELNCIRITEENRGKGSLPSFQSALNKKELLF